VPEDGTGTGTTGSTDTTGGDESTGPSTTSSGVEPDPGSSSGGEPPASDSPGQGCACTAGRERTSAVMPLGLLLLGLGFRSRRSHGDGRVATSS
jgi:MYXO-CTERM domain-containing protein